VDFRAVRDFALECVQATHGGLVQAFTLRAMILRCMDKLLKTKPGEPPPHMRLRKRLQVSVTTLPFCANRRYSEFDSYEDFRNALLASCTMAPLAGLPFKYRGVWVCDGGLSDFKPVIDADTITVSPFYFDYADIKPSRYIPPWWALYPPRVADFAWVFDLGYHDAEAWSRKRWGRRLRRVVPCVGADNNGGGDGGVDDSGGGRLCTEGSNTFRRYSSSSGSSGSSGGGSQPVTPLSPFARPHDLSFGRFFGHRSICKLIPSWTLSLLFFGVFFVLIRPLFAVLVYVELLCRVAVGVACAPCRGCGAPQRACQLFFSPMLMLRGFVPVGRGCCQLDREALCQASFVFRVAVHFI
jgi:hypothetical protein